MLKEESEVDKHIKITVLGDAIRFMRTGALGGFSQISPRAELQQLSVMTDVYEIFSRLAASDISGIGLSNFSKLSRLQLDDRISLDLLH